MISQREARALRKRVAKLESYFQAQREVYASEWPGGVSLGEISWSTDDHRASSVYTARHLGHAVVCVSNGARSIRLFALPLARDRVEKVKAACEGLWGDV